MSTDFAKKVLLGIRPLYPLLDFIMLPFTTVAAFWLRLVKFMGLKRFAFSRRILSKVGVIPIVDHYYEPFYFGKEFNKRRRTISHLEINIDKQLVLLNKFRVFSNEMKKFPVKKSSEEHTFFYDNNTFSYGDADLYYSLIRYYKPNVVCEIGSGFSTLVAYQAISKNKEEGQATSELLCIEPYENEWLEDLGLEIVRKKIEDIDINTFERLKSGDILFIDSSHVIKPGGDVLREVFDILPSLNEGVFIHFHDIFLPYYYPDKWMNEEYRLWNEQYLVEAFLTYNHKFEVVAALNWLICDKPKELQEIFPDLPENAQPSSLWIKKIA